MNKTNPNSITEHRRRKKREKLLIRVIFLCVFVIAVILIVLNSSTIFAPLKGIVGRLTGNTSTSSAGFPVKLPGSASYSLNGYDGGFMLLTDTYIYAYASDGAQNYAEQHGYANPIASVNEKRILAYDRNGRNFSFYGRNGQVYSRATDEKIVYAAIGNGDYSAIVYNDDVYTNVIEVYDGKGEWKYKNRFIDENVMQVAFMDGDKELIVTSIGFKDGDITANVYRFDTNSEDESGVWKISLSPNIIPFGIYIHSGSVFILCDSDLFVLDIESGEFNNRYSFDGDIIDYDFSGGINALLINDSTSGIIRLVSLGGSAELTAETEVTSSASEVIVHNGNIYVLDASGVFNFNADLAEPEFIPFDEEYSDFIGLGKDILLLGYDSVDILPNQ